MHILIDEVNLEDKYKDTTALYFIDAYEVVSLMKLTAMELRNAVTKDFDVFTPIDQIEPILEEALYFTDRYEDLKKALDEINAEVKKKDILEELDDGAE